MHQGQVAGVLLSHLKDGVQVVEGRIVAPGRRNGWPNLVLLEAGLRRARDEGVSVFQFHCDDTVRDTISLAKRCAARETARKALYYYALASD